MVGRGWRQQPRVTLKTSGRPERVVQDERMAVAQPTDVAGYSYWRFVMKSMRAGSPFSATAHGCSASLLGVHRADGGANVRSVAPVRRVTKTSSRGIRQYTQYKEFSTSFGRFASFLLLAGTRTKERRKPSGSLGISGPAGATRHPALALEQPRYDARLLRFAVIDERQHAPCLRPAPWPPARAYGAARPPRGGLGNHKALRDCSRFETCQDALCRVPALRPQARG